MERYVCDKTMVECIRRMPSASNHARQNDSTPLHIVRAVCLHSGVVPTFSHAHASLQSYSVRGPTSVTLTCLNPSLSAGEDGSSLQSPVGGEAICGSPTTECRSRPMRRQASSVQSVGNCSCVCVCVSACAFSHGPRKPHQRAVSSGGGGAVELLGHCSPGPPNTQNEQSSPTAAQ